MEKIIKTMGQVIKRYFSDGVSRASAQLAYYLFFSIFPSLILVNELISHFDVDIIYIIQRLSGILPQQVIDIIVDYLGYLNEINSQSVFFAALFATLYALTRSFNSLLTSVRQAYRIKQGGAFNYITAALLAAVVLLSFILLSVALMGGEILLPHLEEYIHIPAIITSMLRVGRFVLLPVYMLFALCGFYYIVPSRKYGFKYCLPGSLFSVAGLTVVTALFSYYVSHFSHYSVLYGSIAAVMVLMIWLHLVSTFLIMGGEFNDVLIEMHAAKEETPEPAQEKS